MIISLMDDILDPLLDPQFNIIDRQLENIQRLVEMMEETLGGPVLQEMVRSNN